MKLATPKRHATVADMLQYCEGKRRLTLWQIQEQVALYRQYEQRRLAILQQLIIWRTETEQLVPKCLLYKVQVCF